MQSSEAKASIYTDTYPAPHSFMGWIEENRGDFKPPVGNKIMYADRRTQWKVMFVGGPNCRTDYHINMGEEWFYQVYGDMILKVVDGGVFKDVIIREGDCYLHPPNVPHSPQRLANTVGLVMERIRSEDERDGLRWYCQQCKHIVHENFFHCTDLAAELKPRIQAYYASEEMRTCKYCGTVDQAPDRAHAFAIPAEGACVDNGGVVADPNKAALPARDDSVYTVPAPLRNWLYKQHTGSMYSGDCQFDVAIRRQCELPAEPTSTHSEVYFYQLKGTASIHVQSADDDDDVVITLNEGDCYLMPPNTVHATARDNGSIGLELRLN